MFYQIYLKKITFVALFTTLIKNILNIKREIAINEFDVIPIHTLTKIIKTNVQNKATTCSFKRKN